MTVLRRLCAVLMAVVLGGIATPGTSWAGHRDQAPRITVTDIVAPEGKTVYFYESTEIESDGTVLLSLDLGSAIWSRGRFESITELPIGDAPPQPGAADVSGHGQVAVGLTDLPPCDTGLALPFCPRPFLWDDGEVTILPTDGQGGTAVKVTKGGSVVVGLVERYLPDVERFTTELAGWVDGELVKGPEGADDENDIVALNDRGQALIHRGVDGVLNLAVWEVGGSVTDLGTFGDTSPFGARTRGIDINDRGDVVGWVNDPESGRLGFLWRNGETIDLGRMRVTDMNDRGQVIGQCTDPEPMRVYGCMWDDGQRTDLGDLFPIAINNRGQVIGQALEAGPDGDELRAFVWHKGRLTDLSAASGFDGPSTAVDINDRGQILGILGDEYSEDKRHVVWTVSR